MKKLFVFLFSLILSVVFSTSALAYDVQIDGIYYYLISEGKVAEVTWGEEKYSGEVVIPSSITVEGQEYPVASIGIRAFYDCRELTSITIPNSVTSIESCALSGCSGLKDVIIVNNMFVHLPETYSGHYSIPENISQIIGGAFYNCKGLTSVTIGNSVTSIGYYAFHDCSSLTSVTIGNSVTSIEKYTFHGCSGLTSVNIGNSVTSIGESAFKSCSGLTSVTIPNSVTNIGFSAFKNCI